MWDQLVQASSHTNDSSACITRLQHAANNFINDSTALTFIEYTGKGMSDLGIYTSCTNLTNFRYILFNVIMQNTFHAVNIGICSPAECGVEFYNGFKAPMVKLINEFQTQMVVTEDMLTFTDSKEANAEYSKFSIGNGIGLAFIFGLLIFCLVSTIVDRQTNADKVVKPSTKFLRCFSLSRNLSTILYSENRVDKNLDILNGVRVLSCGWVVLGHVFMFTMMGPIWNLTDLLDYLKNSFWFTLITNATVSVDVFFTLSGFLASLGLTQVFSDPKKRKVKAVLMSYLRRYLRLLPIYGALFLIIYNVMPFLGSGPSFSQSKVMLSANCSKYWWANVLYVSNLLNTQNLCIAWSWYISNDMQFFIVTPWIVWVYCVSKVSGILLVIFLILASFGVTAAICIIYKITFSLAALTSMVGTDKTYWSEIYFKPYCRIPTYLIGILLAWAYLAYKDKRFSYKCWDKFNSLYKTKSFRYIGYIAGYAILTFTQLIYSQFNMHYERINRIEDVLYIVLERPIFIIGLMMIIYPVMIGYGKPLLGVLGHQLFNALSKLTYSVYMLHLLMCALIIYDSLQSIEFSMVFLTTKAMDIFTFGLLFGMLSTLVFDSPMLQIEKFYLFPVPPKQIPLPKVDNETPTEGKQSDNLMDKN
jgi:peptidoglycan/LPS O-acetylase OafA/YrhL